VKLSEFFSVNATLPSSTSTDSPAAIGFPLIATIW
jgi:hypothetical protein